MRIVFMGNPAFAIPTLKTILTSTHELAAVVSSPPKPMGRGQQLRRPALVHVRDEVGGPAALLLWKTRRTKSGRRSPGKDREERRPAEGRQAE